MAGETRSNPTQLPPLPAGWRVAAIEDLCKEVTSGGTPLRSNPEFFVGGQHDWFKTGELKDSVLFESSEKITDEALQRSSAKLFPKDTVLMAMYGDGNTITSLGILANEAATNQACCAMLADRAVCDARFLFYAMRFHRGDFIRLASGGAQRNLSGKLIRHFALNVPAPSEQRAIAHILGTLDDKIELNRRMNETLEAMARALFKSWFVDFDPVRAKAEGRDPGLPQPLADLFPDSFEESELGEIPKGWAVQRFAETVEIVGGGTPKTSVAEYWNGGIPWFSVVDAPDGSDVWVVDTEKKISKLGADNSSTRLLPVGTTIISARGTVGKIALVGVPMAMNQSCYGLQGKCGEFGYHTYFATWDLIQSLQQHAHGSVFDTITRDTLAGVFTVTPGRALVEAFELRVQSLMEHLRTGLLESTTLATLRDTLLPKLISGELRLKNVEESLEEAT